VDSIQFLFSTVGSLLEKVAPLPEKRFVVQQGVAGKMMMQGGDALWHVA